jgi:outer membrane receptor protein involved in Fe transport
MSFIRFATSFVAIVILGIAPALADITGLVRGTASVDGKPAAGVTITLRGEGTSEVTTTDARGSFAFSRVTYGHYTITAHRAGYPDASEQVDVASDSIANVSLAIGQLKQIGQTKATTRGASGTPVSANVLGRSQIAVSPNNNSLNSLVETVPGVVKFSYNEPVAHGFHGLTYEVDGAPLPQGTTANFSEVIDPKAIDSLEVFTGAFPAEYGGSRQGAVVNIVSRRINDFAGPYQGTFSLAAGSYGTTLASLSQSLKLGSSQLSVDVNNQGSSRGLDSPTFVPVHDQNSVSDQFVRYITPLGKTSTLAFDLSNQTSIYQIPINTTFNPNDPVLSPPATDDVQREYERFANVVYTRTSKDTNGYFLIAPWTSVSRTIYAGDLRNDVNQVFLDPTSSVCPQTGTTPTTRCFLAGLQEDRHSTFTGLRVSQFHASAHHALKVGIDTSSEAFSSNETIAQNPASVAPGQPTVSSDSVSKSGTQFGAYVEDKWSPSRAVTVNAGLRYDYSNGFVQGNQLSPRIGVNVAVDPKNILHAYFGRLYSAPFLEDTRRACVTVAACSSPNPVYDLKPERDSYMELGVAHTFGPGVTGYVNGWGRNVSNVLDTTQVFPTPIFAVFNNSVGRADGVELRLVDSLRNGDSLSFSGSVSESLAGGISGSTFLFPPSAVSNNSLNPEDHDQTYAANASYTHRFGATKAYFATLAPQYGSGYPVQFQNGPGRLPTHLTFDGVIGREPSKHALGFTLGAENILGHAYLLKVNNGFNTTQWAPGFRMNLKLSAPL